MDEKEEIQLLLDCLNAGTDPGRAAPIENLSADRWEAVLRQSISQGMAPLLYKRLELLRRKSLIPTVISESLRDQYFQNAAKNTRLYHELGKILRRLKNEGIPVIPLKGVHLAEAVYGNIALRSIGDVDLMVKKTELGRVEGKLLELGYRPHEYHRIVAEDNLHFTYKHPELGLLVEVHWNILFPSSPFRIDIEGSWERARPSRIADTDVLALSTEDLILFLCLHLSKHAFASGLRSLWDIFEVVRHYQAEIDWKFIQVLIHEWGIDRPVYLALRLVREFLGAAVPDELLNDLKPGDFDEKLLALAKQQVFAHRRETRDGLALNPNVAQLWGEKRRLWKVALFLRRVFPPRTEMARMYPPPPDSIRILLYYPVRLRDLLLRYGRQAWRMLWFDDEMITMFERDNTLNSLREWLMSP